MAARTILQVLASIVVLVALTRVRSRYRARNLSLPEALGWAALWLGVGVVFWWPESTSRLAEALGIGRGADLTLYAATVLVLYLTFRLTVRLERLERGLTDLVRREALDRTEERDHGDVGR